MSAFCSYISKIDWQGLEKFSDVSVAAEVFQDTLKSLFRIFFPVKTVRWRSSDPPWWNSTLKLLLDDRDRAFSDRNWAKYTRLRDRVIEYTKHLKSVYLKAAQKDSSNGWKAIHAIGKTKKTPNFASSFSVTDFSDFFASSFQNPSPHVHSQPEDFSPSDNSLSVSPGEVVLYLKRLKRKATGSDSIPYWVFKNFAYVFCDAIACIFNRSLSSGIVPSRCASNWLTFSPSPNEVNLVRSHIFGRSLCFRQSQNF